MHNNLKTKNELTRRYIQLGEFFDRCVCHLEDTLQVIRDCMVVKRFWNHIIPTTLRPLFYSLPLRNWLFQNLTSDRVLRSDLKWTTFFGVAIWRLWFCRNQFQFKHTSVDSLSMPNDIRTRAKEINCINNTALVMTSRRVDKWIAWSAPLGHGVS